jgi:ADP-dependent NAD(P)H-hydrate dehydratase / NAD(P)H-hydrate epimerase
MKVLTAAEMREVDRRTSELGIPGIVLMENAGLRVVEFLVQRFGPPGSRCVASPSFQHTASPAQGMAPLSSQRMDPLLSQGMAPLSSERIVVLCGKGNNGGDGMVIARQLHTRFRPRALHVVLLAAPEDLKGDAAANYRMLEACGCPIYRQIPAEARHATLVLDAVLGTGIAGPAAGLALEGIREINSGFPMAQVVAIDIPSGMPSDSGEPVGEFARADCTVTFTAPKLCHAMPPNCDSVGELIVAPIGSPPELLGGAQVELVEPGMFRQLLAPRPRGGHKGTFGHVLAIAGSRGKTGAAALSGMGALRAGAGLVTVASAESAIPQIAAHAAELMTEPLAETPHGTIAINAALARAAEGKTVIAMGPGLGRDAGIRELVAAAVARFEQPMVLDADALVWTGIAAPDRLRIMTPHPGEMARLTGRSTAEVQKDRLGAARAYAAEHRVTLVLKGQRTVIAFPDGRAWINPTGTPALGTGGSGDVLTGLISGLLAQFPGQPDQAVAAAVYLHGLAAEIGVRDLGEQCLIATDILTYLPRAMEQCADVPDRV